MKNLMSKKFWTICMVVGSSCGLVQAEQNQYAVALAQGVEQHSELAKPQSNPAEGLRSKDEAAEQQQFTQAKDNVVTARVAAARAMAQDLLRKKPVILPTQPVRPHGTPTAPNDPVPGNKEDGMFSPRLGGKQTPTPGNRHTPIQSPLPGSGTPVQPVPGN